MSQEHATVSYIKFFQKFSIVNLVGNSKQNARGKRKLIFLRFQKNFNKEKHFLTKDFRKPYG